MSVKSCQSCSKEFRIEPEDFLFYEKIKVPPPTWCPECRMKRRFMCYNWRLLFRRKDDASGNEILSGIPPYTPFKVYERDYWWSDNWDPMDYRQDYDFSRPFFEQFGELRTNIPWPSRSVQQMINSDFCNNAGYLKNSYLCFNSGYGEDSAYTLTALYPMNSFDIYETEHTELCYDSLLIDKCHRVLFSMDCDTCNNVWFSKDLSGCSYCFGCVGLRNKSFYIFNEPHTKEAYLEKIKELDLESAASLDSLRQKAHDFWTKFPVKYMHGYQNTNVSGEHIQNVRNGIHCFTVHEGENLKYSQQLFLKTTDSYDYTLWGTGSSVMYECLSCGDGCYNQRFCYECWPASHDLEYCIDCHSSSDLFGCIGIRKKQYCIFNKQYSPEEYFVLKEKILKHMDEMPYVDKKGRVYKYGEFFPPELCGIAYNDTMAHDYFPLQKEEAEAQGYLWHEAEAHEFDTTVDAKDLPDRIKDVDDSILKEVIKCFSCAKAYRVIQMELNFFRLMGLPLPRLCPNCRFTGRFKFINQLNLWHRQCQCAGSQDDHSIYKNQASHFHGSNPCPNEFQTSYSPDRPEIVYCEQCYQNEVV